MKHEKDEMREIALKRYHKYIAEYHPNSKIIETINGMKVLSNTGFHGNKYINQCRQRVENELNIQLNFKRDPNLIAIVR